MKIGIIGYRGFVGSAIFAHFWAKYPSQVTGIGRENYADAPKNYDVLINANGNPSKRLADKEPKTDFGMNVASAMAALADFGFGKYIHISSVDVYNDHEDQDRNKEDGEITEQYLSNYGFDKLMAERLVRRYAKSHLIFRLGGMVGPNLKKNMVYDIMHLGKTFVSPLSKYQYIDTPSVARVISEILEQGIENETFNLCGEGTVTGEEVAEMAGKGLEMALYEQPRENYDINISKVCRFTEVPKSRDAVRKYMEFVKTGSWGEE
jgi:nucleoside-diphosphate-sugar epimerase